jgi:hypothetical protein
MTADNSTGDDRHEGTDTQNDPEAPYRFDRNVTVPSGTHNPEHAHGEAVAKVSTIPTRPENTVRLGVEYPNGTFSCMNLTPATAERIATALLQAVATVGKRPGGSEADRAAADRAAATRAGREVVDRPAEDRAAE